MFKWKMFMASFTFVLLSLASGVEDIFPTNSEELIFYMSKKDAFEIFLTKILENLRQAMLNGIPFLNIPPLDPLDVGNMNVDESPIEEITQLHGSIDLISLKGASNFQIEKASSTLLPPSIHLLLHWPTLTLAGKYDLAGKLHGVQSFQGKGDFTIAVNKIDAGIDLVFKIKSGLKLGVESVELILDIDTVNVNFENISGEVDPDLVNEHLSERIYTMFEKNVKAKLPDLNIKIRDTLDDLLEGMDN